MPEAAMYEYYSLVFGEYYVGLAGQTFYMQAVAVAMGMQIAAHKHFGLGIFALYSAHVVAACCFAVYVGHCGVAVGICKVERKTMPVGWAAFA